MQMQPYVCKERDTETAQWQPLRGGPEERAFQFFPIQVGGPTTYAHSRRYAFIAISVYQLLMALMALIEFQNYLSGILMIIGCLIAWWAVKEDMNITYICWWGVLSLAGVIAGIVVAFIDIFALPSFAVKISTMLIKFNIPLASFCGVVLAWWLYKDYEVQHPASTDMVATWLRAYGLMKQKATPRQADRASSGATLLSQDQIAQYNFAHRFDAIKGSANAAMGQAGSYGAAYGAMGQHTFADAQAHSDYYAPAYAAAGQENLPGAQAQAGPYGQAFGAVGQDNLAAAQAKAEEGGFNSSLFGAPAGAQHFATAPVPSNLLSGKSLQGASNLKHDPFMTKS